MKKKKPPVALLSVLVVAVLGLVISSQAFRFWNQTAEEQQKQLQQEAMDRNKAKPLTPDAEKLDSKTQVAGLTDRLKEKEGKKDKMKDGTGAPGSPKQAAMSASAEMAQVPSIVMPSTAVVKPVPNTAATSSQWYDKN
jgi:cytoskeletal protein RodZ